MRTLLIGIDSGTQSTKALVVDDSPEILHLVASALRRDGFEVREAPSGDRAAVSVCGATT